MDTEQRNEILKKARQVARENPKPRQLNPLIKAQETPTRGNAIKAMCSHCMGCTEDFISENYRADIRNCTAPKCPLYPFRPFQRKQAKPTQEQSA